MYTVRTVHFVSCAVNLCDFTIHALEKKKKKKAENMKVDPRKRSLNPNHMVSFYLTFFFLTLIVLKYY